MDHSSCANSSPSLISTLDGSAATGASSSTLPKARDLEYCPKRLPPLRLRMSLSHSSKFYSVNDDFITEKTLRWGLMSSTEGKPENRLNWSCSSWWSPASAQRKLTGLSLKLLTVCISAQLRP